VVETNVEQTPLSRWLDDVRGRNLTLSQLHTFISNRRTCVREIYDVLDGRFASHKARALYVRWNGVQPEEVVKPVAVENTNPHNLKVPCGTKFKSSPGASYQTEYKLVYLPERKSYNLFHGENFEKNAGISTVSQIEVSFVSKNWVPTSNHSFIADMIANYTNIVKAEEMIITNRLSNGEEKGVKFAAGLEQYVLMIGGDYGHSVYIHPGGTGNCQLTVVAYMNTLLTHSTNVKEQLREIQKKAGRRMIMCDLNYHFVDKLKKAVGANAVQTMPYTSTNHSSMVICLIDLTKMEDGKK
jgi:hypothetical protein